MTLQESIQFAEAQLTMMKVAGMPELKMTIEAYGNVIAYAKEQYSKQLREEVLKDRFGDSFNGGESDGRESGKN